MGTITLNDGTVLINSHAIESNNSLFVYIKNGESLRAVFNKLIEPTKTEKITANRYGTEMVYEGYQKLVDVRDEENGMITAVLKKN